MGVIRKILPTVVVCADCLHVREGYEDTLNGRVVTQAVCGLRAIDCRTERGRRGRCGVFGMFYINRRALSNDY